MNNLEQKSRISDQTKGIIITLIAGTLWGFSGNLAQFLFTGYSITPLHLTALRQIFSGIILTILALVKYRDNVKALLSKPVNVFRLFIFAIFGIMFNQLSYLETISFTNSGTATILQYIGPVLVVVVSCFLNRRLPTLKESLAVILVVIGTFLIATHGDPGTLYMTPIGLTWGLLSAVAMVLYTMLPVSLIRTYGSIPVVGLSMLICGITLAIFHRFRGGPSHTDSTYFIFVTITVILGTVIPYTLYLTGVSLCGPVRGSMVASIEPVSATVIMVLWLGEPFYKVEFVGFFCIFITVFLLAKKEKEPGSKV